MTVLILLLETLVAPFAALGVLLSFALSRKRGRLSGLGAELPERLGGLAPEGRAKLAGRRVWWLHAASAGEVAGLLPVLEERAKRPDAPAFLVTTTTVAGREAARWSPAVAWTQLAPLDAWPCVARFLRAAKPERLILCETELWPTTLILAARAGLRPVLVNGRLTERSLARLRLLRPLLRPALDALAAVGAQTEPEAGRFVALGVAPDKARATGNAKYDRGEVPAAAEPRGGAAGPRGGAAGPRGGAAGPRGGAAEDADFRLQRLGWKDAPLFVAGSTHPVEEDAVLAGFLQARARVPGLRLVLVPRHVERADEAWKSLKDASLKRARWSKIAPGVSLPADAEALLVDEMGALPALYARALVAYVGGTLVPVGGHNLLEPALAGVPVLFGPRTEHTELPAVLLEDGGGGRRVRDARELGDRLAELAGAPERARAVGAKARELAATLRGAAARSVDLIEGSRA